MLNDWKWEKIDDYEYVVRDNNNAIIIQLIQIWDKQWRCAFYNDKYELKYYTNFPGDTTIEEIQWQATLWVNEQCNNIANSFHHIRDHLPSIHDLFDKTIKL